MAVAKVYNGSSWDDAVINVYDGSAWVEKASFYDGSAWQELYSSAVSVIVNALKTIQDLVFSGTAYTWVGVNNDGDLYSSTTGETPNVSYETWLDAGLNSQVWVEATLTGISPDTLSSGSSALGSRLACTSDRKWGYTATTGNTLTGAVLLDFYDAASGGTLLDSQSVSLNADASGI